MKTLTAKTSRGFTLIELLIVVLIIAILAAIAVPNFLEFQTRAKVSRVKSDMRAIVTALEAYYVDNNEMPLLRLYLEGGNSQWDRGGIYNAVDLTTPISYLSSVNLVDPFQPPSATDQFGDLTNEAQGEVSKTINYVNIELYRKLNNYDHGFAAKYVLISYGPDKFRGPIPGEGTPYLSTYALDPTIQDRNWFVYAQYDPTNGTVSGGDIIRYQGRSFN